MPDGSIVEVECPFVDLDTRPSGVRSLAFHQGAVRGIGYSANFVFFVSCGDDGCILLSVVSKSADRWGLFER